MRGGALSCHHPRRVGTGQAGTQREEKPAGTAVRKAPAPWRAGDENREDGGADPAGHGGHRAAGSVLFLLPAAVFLRHALAAAAVRHLRIHQLARGGGAAGLRAADSSVHRGGVPLCKAHIRQILGQIHRHGRRVFRQRAGAEGAEALPRGRKAAGVYERERRGISENHHESPCHAACQRDHHGPCGLWRRGHRCGAGGIGNAERRRHCRRAVSGAGGGGVLPAAPGLRKRLPCGHERGQRGANDADAAGGAGARMGRGAALRREAGAGGRAFFLCAGAGDAARRIRCVS